MYLCARSFILAGIVAENKKDLLNEDKTKRDRLMLNQARIAAIAADAENVASLPDEVNQVIKQDIRPNGLDITLKRVPIGVVGIIYESRPNVTVDATVLALKSGNAVVLKGGKEAINSNRILVKLMQEALKQSGITPEAIQFLDTTERKATNELLQARGLVDVLIPRGGRSLIDFVNQNAKIPCIETGASVVHTFVDASADLKMALEIVVNEKMRRVSVCNALDTLLVHRDIANQFLPKLAEKLDSKVKLHLDNQAMEILVGANSRIHTYAQDKNIFLPLQEQDLSTEWLDYQMSVVVVENLGAALQHIDQYSLGHSEAIITENDDNAVKFLNQVDAACVYHNTSTCFSDGAQFGLGAEIGISTQKLHVRGPFALQGLTTTKWVIKGKGQVRN